MSWDTTISFTNLACKYYSSLSLLLLGFEWATFLGFLFGLGLVLGFVLLSLKLSSPFIMVYANIKKSIAID